MAVKEVRTRFAPSPTGFMHVGNLRTALYEYLIAKSQGGKFILRIEDTDQERLVEGATQVIYDTLAKVSIIHDEGPDIGGPFGPYVQSERLSLYKPYAIELVEKEHAYYCFCTKERLDSLRISNSDAEDNSFPAGYDRHCRDFSKDEISNKLAMNSPYIIRQKMPLSGKTTFNDAVYGSITVDNDELEDQVLLKSDGFPTYNFANVVDDHLMKISHVIRGSEYLSSAPKYNLLYEAFGWEIPLYVHLSLIQGKNPDGTVSKLSKRHGATSFEDLLNDGYLTEAIINYIALLGWCPKENIEVMSMSELISLFSIDGISKSPAIFDYDKLRWFNAEYIRAMPILDFQNRALPYYKELFGDMLLDYEKISEILQPRITQFTQIPAMISFLKELPTYSSEFYIHKKMKTTKESSLEKLKEILPNIVSLADWSQQNIHDMLIKFAIDKEIKNGQIMWPVRTAISGVEVTPGGAVEILTILGKEESIRRINMGIKLLEDELEY